MLFNSISYAIFLPVVFLLYWAFPQKCKWVLLLLASTFFYMCAGPKYIILLAFDAFISYFFARRIADGAQRYRKLYLVLGLLMIFSVLFVFKYWNFALQSIEQLFSMLSIHLAPATLALVLPVGISFYTFQTTAYIVDVYREEAIPEKNFGVYLTFVSFFPQLVAGPIERTNNLLPQIRAPKPFDYDLAAHGLRLMAWGFFKKMVVADTIGVSVDAIFSNIRNYSGFSLVVASIFFTFQIYCDFSGYSDIAIGTAELFGIRLIKNFNAPYFAVSVKDFWRRWHISLSTWFRDYVYIPLGGNRVGKLRYIFNIMVTFLLSGLWHGAAWHFVFWGGCHGLAQVIETFLFRKNNANRFRPLRILITFIFVSFAWIFFRTSISDGIYMITHMFSGLSSPASYFDGTLAALGMSYSHVLFVGAAILVLLIYDCISQKRDVMADFAKVPTVIRWICYFGFLIFLLAFCLRASSTAFIYFQF